MSDRFIYLPTSFHPILGQAEEMAKEFCQLYGGFVEYDSLVNVFEFMLSDLSRPATRDFWIRWLIQNDVENAEFLCTPNFNGTSYEAYVDGYGLICVAQTEKTILECMKIWFSDGKHVEHLRDNPHKLRERLISTESYNNWS